MATQPQSLRLDPEQREWLGRLYEEHEASVSRLCMRLLNDQSEAADACQEVFIRAANALGSPPLSENARSWLLTVARNHCLDLLRRRKRFDKALTVIWRDLEAPRDPESAAIDHDTLVSVLGSLTPRERTVLWQSAVEQQPVSAIADGMKLNYMAAAQVLSRARRHAATIAARVAAIFGLPSLYRLLRQGRGAPSQQFVLQAAQIAAVVAVPVLLISVQSSTGSARQQAPVPAISTSAGPSSAASNRAGATGVMPSGAGLPAISPPIQISASPVPVPSAVGSTVNQLTKVLPSISPSLPPLPSALPLPTALPSPPPVP